MDTLVSSIDLIKQSFQIFKSKFKNLFILSVLYAAAVILLSLLTGIDPDAVQDSSFVFISIVSIISFIIVSLFGVSLIYIIVEGKDIKALDALKLGYKKLLSVLWVNVLNMVIVLIGMILFVIPGIIFFVWFYFAIYILVFEDVNGWAALKKSKEMVSGKWWKIFGRLIVLFCVILPVYLLSIIPFGEIVGDMIAIPFSTIYSYLLYKNLKAI